MNMNMKERAFKLCKEWCDALLTYQVDTKTPYTDGGLLCPACHVIHGRIADLCFPLTVLWHETGDMHYLDEADRLIDWSEYNLVTGDGLWYNDITNRWFGTGAFSALAIGEALFHFGGELPAQYKDKWMRIFLRMSDAVAKLSERKGFDPVTNYYCGFAAELAMAWRLSGDERYYECSRYWLNGALSRIDSEGLLYGERYPMCNADGSHTVDMGYSLEESLPLLLRYASLTGEHMEGFCQMLRTHLYFLLPDGGIDNSFGSRHNKWTYWGSRTSDGLIEGLALVLGEDPMFVTACERVLSLYERCTHNGLLAMPMAHEVGEPTCLHHTFPHAKALASLICAEDIPEHIPGGELPCQKKDGVRLYQNGKLITVSHGVFRATFSAIDTELFHSEPYLSNAGGAMGLLYHDRFGILCAATSAQYVPTEPLNQQFLRNACSPPSMTVQFLIDGGLSCCERNVTLSSEGNTVTAKGEKWQASYRFYDTELEIVLTSAEGVYQLPIVCSKETHASLSEDEMKLSFADGLTVTSTAPMEVDTDKRIFHQVGGLLYLPIKVRVCGTVRLILG